MTKHWFDRWGYIAFWLLIILGFATYDALSPPKHLVVDKRGEPIGLWSEFKLQIQGKRFFEAQRQAVRFAIERKEQEILKSRERFSKQEVFRAQLSAAIPRQQNVDPYTSQAERLEDQADSLRERGIQNFSEKIDQSILNDLRETESSIFQRLNSF